MRIRHRFAATLLIAALTAGAAQFAPADAQQAPPSGQEAQGGTGPDHMGSTGWSGSHKGENTGATDGAADQPLMATGIDLKGPPRRFPPSETPE